MKRTLLLSAVFLPLLLVGLSACGDEGAARPGNQLSVEDFAFTQLEDGTRVFTGKVYNDGDEPVRQAQISVSLLDSENRQIGSTTIGVTDIVPQDTTSFREVFDSDQDVSGARMRSLTVM